ncbi:hypothetical protein [Floridanema evergladense]|uniref:Uncharacterized protein n=1 Tax=Floridaenema evergladense BLCC-F167 TaxID=3153639 RepID=A0ABV4WDE9_9CYAN
MALAQLNQPKRGKKHLTNLLSWQQAASAIVQQYHVQGLLQLDYQVTHTKRHLRGYRQRPPRIVSESKIQLIELLAAFGDITLLLIDVPDRTYLHLTPLSPLQQRILSLLCLTVEIYTQLCVDDAVP